MSTLENRAVVERRTEAMTGLDYFPTPPWATRALIRWMVEAGVCRVDQCVWEPASGCGHMADVLREAFAHVCASDVHDYGYCDAVGSFTGIGPDVAERPGHVDWVITNPPFNLAEFFLQRGLIQSARGVALLLRTNWLDTQGRFERVFRRYRPSHVLQFSERVAMVKGRWDPEASTATAYAWFVWLHQSPRPTVLDWIPPGTKDELTRASDVARFAGRMPRHA